MQRFLEHAERFNTEIVFDHINTVDLRQAPVHADGRLGDLHLRRADHRHRRLGQVPRPAVASRRSWAAASAAAPPATASSIAARTSASSAAATPRSKRRCTSSNIASKVHLIHRRDKFRAEPILIDKLMDKVDGRQDRAAALARRSTRCWATRPASPACALKNTQDGAHRGADAARAASSRSATSRTPTSSRASSR